VWVAEGGLFREQNIRYTLNPTQSSRLLRSRVMLVVMHPRPGQSRSAPLDPASACSDAGLLTAPCRGICQAASAAGVLHEVASDDDDLFPLLRHPGRGHQRIAGWGRSISYGPQWRQPAPRRLPAGSSGLEHRARRGKPVRGVAPDLLEAG
jgi:hypothetical protein